MYPGSLSRVFSKTFIFLGFLKILWHFYYQIVSGVIFQCTTWVLDHIFFKKKVIHTRSPSCFRDRVHIRSWQHVFCRHVVPWSYGHPVSGNNTDSLTLPYSGSQDFYFCGSVVCFSNRDGVGDDRGQYTRNKKSIVFVFTRYFYRPSSVFLPISESIVSVFLGGNVLCFRSWATMSSVCVHGGETLTTRWRRRFNASCVLCQRGELLWCEDGGRVVHIQ